MQCGDCYGRIVEPFAVGRVFCEARLLCELCARRRNRGEGSEESFLAMARETVAHWRADEAVRVRWEEDAARRDAIARQERLQALIRQESADARQSEMDRYLETVRERKRVLRYRIDRCLVLGLRPEPVSRYFSHKARLGRARRAKLREMGSAARWSAHYRGFREFPYWRADAPSDHTVHPSAPDEDMGELPPWADGCVERLVARDGVVEVLA